MKPYEQYIEKIIRLSHEAGEKIMAVYNSDFTVENKEDDSPLTEADMRSHHTICDGLASLTPDIPVLSEESSAIPFEERRHWQVYWLIDPLDGTREFIKRNGEFTVNIALIANNRPVLGVVHVPVKGTTYYACVEAGAYKLEDGIAKEINTRRTRTDQLAVAGSRSHGSEKQKTFFRHLGDIEIYAIGSSLKFCLVAEGKVDIYPRFGPTSEWDTAAAQCIVEQAGGMVTDDALNPIRYNTKASILNPDFLVIADKSFDWSPYLSGI